MPIALAILLSLVGSFVSAAELAPKTIDDFSPGLHTTVDPTYIPDGAAQDLQNVDVWTGRIETRDGTVLQNQTTLGSYSNQPVRFLHEFPANDGSFWLLSLSSATLFKSENAGGTNSVLTSTHGLTTDSQLQATNAFGKARLTDGTTNWILWDGTSVSVSTASPKGKLAEFAFDRVFTADVTSFRSTLYASRNGDPEDWTDDGLVDSDAFSFTVRQNNGYPIRALKRFKNSLLIFKDYSIDQLTMSSDGLTPILTPISSNIGTQHRDSVRVRENDVIFLGHDAFYKFDGVALTPISEAIEPTIKTINQLSSIQNTITIDTAGEWGAGTLNNLSSTTVSGSVAVIESTYVPPNNSFETGTSFATGWTVTTTTNVTVSWGNNTFTVDTTYGAKAIQFVNNDAPSVTVSSAIVVAVNPSNVVLSSSTNFLPQLSGTAAYDPATVFLSGIAGVSVKYRIHVTLSNGRTGYVTSDTAVTGNGPVTLYGVEVLPVGFEIGRIDFGISTGTYLSTNFTTTGSNSFGQFTAAKTGSSATTYVIYTDTNTVISTATASTFISSQTITSGAVPSIMPSDYAFIGITQFEDLDGSTTTIDSVELAHFTGAGGQETIVSSIYYDQEYLTAVSISSPTANDTILVYDRNGRWTRYTGLPVYYWTTYRQFPYFGSNIEGKIFRAQVDGQMSDNGTAIDAYWISKEFDFGFPITDKTTTRYYVTGQYVANSDATFEYGVNRGTLTSETLDFDSVSGFFRRTIIPSSLTYQRGITHRFKISNNEADDIFSILSVTIKARTEVDP